MRTTVRNARVRRSLLTYLGAAALVLVVVAVGATLVGRQVAQDEALRDASTRRSARRASWSLPCSSTYLERPAIDRQRSRRVVGLAGQR